MNDTYILMGPEILDKWNDETYWRRNRNGNLCHSRTCTIYRLFDFFSFVVNLPNAKPIYGGRFLTEDAAKEAAYQKLVDNYTGAGGSVTLNNLVIS